MLQKSFANSRTAGTGTREFRPKWKKILVCGLDFKLLCCRRAAYFRLEEWKYFRWTEKPNRWEMVKGTNETHTQWPTILTIRPKECENWKTTTENKDKMDFERFVIIPFVCVYELFVYVLTTTFRFCTADAAEISCTTHLICSVQNIFEQK